ncbi:hypothetical protein CR983_04095 [Candidatus Saccharibacteria bacterium]|nr:MAG: hypothetical protein CR983_04095 [Candidatus Saccharibacteria bacterium]
MEHVPTPSDDELAHLEWQSEADRAESQRQAEVYEVLAGLQPLINSTNEILAHFHPTIDGKNASRQIAHNNLQSINELWKPYVGHRFFVSGQWYEPLWNANLQSSSFQIRADHSLSDAARPAVSREFSIARVKNEQSDEWQDRVVLPFYLYALNIDLPSHRARVELQAFGEPHRLTMYHLGSAPAEAEKPVPSDIVQTVQNVNAKIQDELGNPNASFYTKNPNEQRRSMQAFADIVDEALPAPFSADTAKLTNAKVSAFYKLNDAGKPIRYSSSDGSLVSVSGRIAGAVAPDIWCQDRDTAFVAPNETDTAKDGICFIVKAFDDKGVFEPGFVRADLILVPASQIIGQSDDTLRVV